MDGNAIPNRSQKARGQFLESDENLDRELSIDLERLARSYADDFDMQSAVSTDVNGQQVELDSAEHDEVSLEELSQAFAKVVGANTNQPPATEGTEYATKSSADDSARIVALQSSASDKNSSRIGVADAEPMDSHTDGGHFPVSPQSIVESVLLIGRPDSGPITATEIAGLMRGVSEFEVDKMVAELNAEYIADCRAFYIASIGGGYRMQLANDLDGIRQAFLGPSKPVRLSQSAIDCMSLVSYQPGIQREQLDAQLGKPTGGILNQLVRRELLEIRREKVEGEKKLVPRYYPTQRLLDLAGLETLDDLPTAEEWVDRV